MRIYLLNPPFLPRFLRCQRWQGGASRGGTLWYPIWLSYAAAALQRSYENVRLADAPAWNWGRDEVLKDAMGFQPDLIVIDTNFSSVRNDVGVATALKDGVPGATTVIVGPPAAEYAGEILHSPGVDAVARFEYEMSLLEIARALEYGRDLDGVEGISYRRGSAIVHNPERPLMTGTELDGIPFVSEVYKEHLGIADYFLSHTLHPEVQIFTGRGCPNLCTFCAWPETLMGRTYRVRSVQNVVDEMEYIVTDLHEVKEIFIEDDTFTASSRRVREICGEITNRRLAVTWSCNARADLDLETMMAMKKAGCRLVDVGYESGSDQILKNIRKGISTDRMRRFAKDARKAGLMVLGDFIVGLPGETEATVRETIRFAKELKPNLIQFAVATPLPGTEFYQWAKTEGFLLTENLEESLDESGFQRCIISYPEFSNSDIERWVDTALKSYYLSPAYVPIALDNVLRRNGFDEFKGLMKSATTFFEYLTR